MTLNELIIAVKEQSLSKDELEDYQQQMCSLFAQMQIEMADLEKNEALYMNGKNDVESVANRKITWKATKEGQRLIVLKRYSLALKTLLSSLKSRLYNTY